MRWLISILIFIFSYSVKAQTSTKAITRQFAYESAEQKSKDIVEIQVKDGKGEVYVLQLSLQATIKNAEALYTQVAGANSANKPSATKAESVGKSFQFIILPIGEIDPANPYCCYQITAVNPL